MSTLYASFIDAEAAERAVGALIDQGAKATDISVVANEAYNSLRAVNANNEALDAEKSGKSGISTTTGTDAAIGAVKGVTIGVGVGIAAALASVFIPGVGLILGGGALATAIAGGAATAAAGAATGGVVGYLRDQGIPDEVVTHYSDHFIKGGAILAIGIPSGDLSSGQIEGMLVKYGAHNIATYNSTNVLIDNPMASPPQVPLIVNKPNMDPIAVMPSDAAVVLTPEPEIKRVVEASTGETRLVAIEHNSMADLVDAGVVVAPLTDYERSIAVSNAVVIDPVTGLERPATVGEKLSGEAVTPVVADVDETVVVVKKPDVELY